MGNDLHDQLLDRFRRQGAKPLPTSALGRLQKSAVVAARVAGATLTGHLQGSRTGASLSPQAAAKLAEGLGELKGAAMKAGQMLSYVDLSLGPEARRILATLQVMSPPSALTHVQQTIREDLGPRAAQLLARLQAEPVASASIGQVHRAWLDDGTPVAVKVRHPGIEDAIRADFRTASFGTLFASLLAPGIKVDEMLAEAELRFLEECDYEREARHQARFRELFATHASITIPTLHPQLCGPRVLTSTWHDGLGLDAFLAGAPFAAERVRAARALYEFYVGTLYRHGLFNADPHPGNLLFAADGVATILDHGCVRAFEPDVVQALLALSQSVRQDDASAVQAALAALGMRNPNADYDVTRELLRGFYAPLLRGGRRAVTAEQTISLRQVAKLKRGLLRVRLPGKLLFLFRVRVGLYAVLARIGAKLDWIALEEELAGRAESI